METTHEQKDDIPSRLKDNQLDSWEEEFNKYFGEISRNTNFGFGELDGEKHLKDFISNQIQKARVIEHCDDINCPECNKKAYKKGCKDEKEKIRDFILKNHYTVKYSDSTKTNRCLIEVSVLLAYLEK